MTDLNRLVSDKDKVVWIYKNKDENQVFDEIGIISNNNLYISFTYNNVKNLIKLYEELLELCPKESLLFEMVEENIEKTKLIAPFFEATKSMREIKHVPYELIVLNKKWVWYTYVHELLQEKVINKLYGITADGYGVQIKDCFFALNLVPYLYKILLLVPDNPLTGGILDALMLLEDRYEHFVREGVLPSFRL